MLRRPSFLGRTAIAGVGYSSLSRRSGRSVLALAVEATREAIADAGLQLADIDGIVSYSWLGDSATTHAVATCLGLPSAHYLLDTSLGGQAPCFLVANAAARCRAVLLGLGHGVKRQHPQGAGVRST